MKNNAKKTPKVLILVVALVALIALGAVGIWALLGSEPKVEEVPTEDVYEYVNPDESKAQPDEGFTIDGVLDEKEYLKNKWLYLHNDDGGNNVDIAMTSYYGEKGMYFVYDVTESVPIYVNLDRASYLNSCIEMYFAPSTVTTLSGNSVFEVDLLPTGDMVFKQANGKGGYVGVATTDDVMAYLGATTKGGDVNTESCYGYCLELFIPWDYMQWLGMDVEAMKDSFVYVDPAHITSNNFNGTDTSVDRYWYFYAQQHGASFGNVYQYFRFDANGAQGTVATKLTEGDHYTITGDPYVIPGMLTNVTITPEQGYALNSVLVNGEEYIGKASYNEDGSVTLKVRGEKDGLTVSAAAEKVTEGDKTLRGTIKLHSIGWDSLDGALISYTGPNGEKALVVDAGGKFELTGLKQGYYTVNVEKKGYQTVSHGIYLNRDIETEISLEFETFYSESGSCWVLDDQNDGIIRKFGGQGFVLTNAAYDDFTFEANFKYVQSLNEEKTTTSHFTEQRMGMRIRFSNGQYWNINLLKQNGEYILQYAARSGSVFTKYKHIHTLTDEQIAKYTSDAGIALRVVRDGQLASVYLDGELLAVEDLGAEYKDCTAQLGFEAWVANREIMDIPFTITGKALTDVASSYFYKPSGWVITGQYEGKLYVEGSEKSNWLNFGKKYVNMDLTLNAKDYIGSETPLRLVVAMNFDNGKNATFSITYSDGEYKLQAMGDSIFGWRNFYKLTDEEIAKFQSEDGIDFRIVRVGTEVSLYLDGREVCSGLDLTGKESGVTADMPATVAIRHYGNVGHTVEIPFAMTEEMNVGTVTVVDSENGGIAVNKYHYMIGDTIYLSDAGEDGYYCTGMKVNGETVPMHWDGTYSFKTSEKEYTVEGSFAKAVFKNQSNWDLMEQNKGIITRHDGIGEGWLEMIGTHVDLDITMTLKGIDETSAGGVRFVFKNDTVDEWATFRIVCEKGVWKLKSMNDSVFNWATFHELTAQQVEKYLSDEGIDFRVVRQGTDVYLYLDGERVCDTIDLTVDYNGEKTGITADMEAVVRVRHYGTTGKDIEIPFAVTDKVEAVTVKSEKSENGTVGTLYRSYLLGDSITLVGDGKDHYYCTAMTLNGKAVELAVNGTYTFKADKKEYTVGGTFEEGTFVYDSESGWDIRNQNEGVVALPGGGNGGWLEFYNKFTDVDITLNVQDYAGGEKDPRTELLFAFDTDGDGVYTDAYVTYGVLSEANNNKAFIQSMPVKNLGTGVYGDKYPNHGNLTAEEYADFIDGGVRLRVVRSGTDVHLYIGDRKVNVKDLTENETGIKADTKMTVYIRHYDDTGVTVEIPFEVTDKVQTVEVIAGSCENGAIVTQFTKYLKNDTIVFFGQGVDHYYCNAMEVNGEAVTQHWNGTYSVKATENTYTVNGNFVPGIFAYNDGWNLLKQNEGKITVKYTNANGNSNWLDFYDKYTDMDVTLNVREYADDVKGALTRSAIRFTFDNGEIITFSIAKNSGNKYTVQALSGDTIVDKSHDFYVMDADDIAALNSEDGIDFRVIKEGTEVDIYFGNVKVVENFDLTTGDSGVTADMEAKVSIRRFDDPDIDAEYTVKVSEDIPADDKVIVSIDGTENGTVETKWNSHIVGEKVILNVAPADGYYCKSLTVTKDGEPVELNEVLNIDGGAFTFTAEQEGTYTVGAVFAKKVFVTNPGWDLLQQSTGVVAIPNGGNGGWLEFIDKYTDVDITLNVQDYADGNKDPRTELLLVFENGAHVSFGITCDNTHAWIQSLNQADDDGKQIYNRYKGHGELTAEEYADFTDGGVDFRMVRKGTDIHLYIGDRKVNVLSLTNNDSGVTADTKMTVYIRHYDDSGVRVEIPFEVSNTAPDAVDVTVNATNNGEFNTHVSKYLKGDYVVLIPAAADGYACSGLSVNGSSIDKLAWDGTHTFQATEDSYTVSGSFAKKLFKDHANWNTVNQHFGVLSASATQSTGGAYLATTGKYSVVTVKLQNPISTNEYSEAVKLTFEGVEGCFSVQVWGKNGSYYIKPTDGGNFFGTGYNYYKLSQAQAAKVENGGLELTIAKVGTNIVMFLDDAAAANRLNLSYKINGEQKTSDYLDLTMDQNGNATGIVADTMATIGFRSWGVATNAGSVEIPFKLEAVQPAHSTVSIPTMENGKVTADKKVYLPGETVTLTVTPAEGYYNKSIAVKNGESDVTLNGTFNIDGGSYTFTAGEGTNAYTVEATFKEKLFVTDSDWNLTDQDEGKISTTISGASNVNTGHMETYGSYSAITLDIKNPNGAIAAYSMELQLHFAVTGNPFVSIQVYGTGDKYVIKSIRGGAVFGNQTNDGDANCYYALRNDEVAAVKNGGARLKIVKAGTNLLMYLDTDLTDSEEGYRLTELTYKVNGVKQTNSHLDLTENINGDATNIAADTKMKVKICAWSVGEGNTLELPFKFEEGQPEFTTITIADTENGKIAADKTIALEGESVTLTVTPAETNVADEHILETLKVNDEDVTDKVADGKYTFIVADGVDAYTVDASFKRMIFWKQNGSAWDLSAQSNGLVARPNSTGNTGWTETYRNDYRDVSLTVSDKTPDSNDFKMAINFTFSNGQNFKISLTNADTGALGVYKVQILDGNTVCKNWATVGNLSDAQVTKLKSTQGIVFRVVFTGSTANIYLDGEWFGSVDCSKLWTEGKTKTDTDSGIASATAKISLKMWGNVSQSVDVPFALGGNPETVTVDVSKVDMTNGKVTLNHEGDYIVGEKVVLAITPDSGYYHNLKLNGESILLDWDSDTYSFDVTDANEEYVITGSFDADEWEEGSVLDKNQHAGVLGFSYTEGSNSGWIKNTGHYTKIRMIVKDYVGLENSGASGKEFSFCGQFTFLDEANIGARVINEKGTYKITMVWSPWICDITNAEWIQKIQTTGARFELVLNGNNFEIWFEGTLIHSQTCGYNASTNPVRYVRFRSYGNYASTAYDVELPYELTLKE